MVGRVADVSTLFDEDGILVRFMNGQLEGNGIRDSASAGNLISQVRNRPSCCSFAQHVPEEHCLHIQR